jgi:Zn-finger nucleic acid-binding protein
MSRNCPDCLIATRVETIYGVSLDVCDRCAGIWFDADEIRTLLARDPIVMVTLEDSTVPTVDPVYRRPSERHCPDCAVPLHEYHYLYSSPVSLDACTDCGGIWVEDSELRQMQHWLDSVRKPDAVQTATGAVLAAAVADHSRELARYEGLGLFVKTLRRNVPWWSRYMGPG